MFYMPSDKRMYHIIKEYRGGETTTTTTTNPIEA
jgi:hypothetical protein